MKKGKRFLAAIMAAVVFTVGCSGEAKSKPMLKEDFTYITNDFYHSAFITGYSGDGTDFICPTDFDGYYVNTIMEEAFIGNRKLKTVDITTDRIFLINDAAFLGCSELTTVTIKTDSYISIGTRAFQDCQKLTDVILPDKVSIAVNAFENSPNIKISYKGNIYTANHLTDLFNAVKESQSEW